MLFLARSRPWFDEGEWTVLMLCRKVLLVGFKIEIADWDLVLICWIDS